jgi:hypothetical protein
MNDATSGALNFMLAFFIIVPIAVIYLIAFIIKQIGKRDSK